MASDLSAFAPLTLTLAFTYLLHSTLLLGGAWLIVRKGRVRSEALKERVWKLAAVLGLVTAPLQLLLHVAPPAFELTMGGTPSGQVSGAAVASATIEIPAEAFVTPAIPDATVPRLPAESRQHAQAIVANDPLKDRTPDGSVPSAVEPATWPASHETTSTGKRPVLTWIACAFVGAFCAGIARLVLQTVLLYRHLKDSSVIRDPSAFRMLAEISRRGRVRRQFRLLASPTFRQPAAFGLFRWTIVLPEDVLRTFQPNELHALLAHEAAHLVRGDAIWLWAGRILCSCFATQPLNFVARREWRRSSEMLCDQWAVHHAANGLALARCLTRVAESNCLVPPRLQALWALETPSHLTQRVERLLDGACESDAWDSRARRRLIAIAALGIATAFVWAAPRTRVLANAAEPLSAGGERAVERTNMHLLGDEIRELSAEIEHVSHLVQSRLPTNRKATELAARISDRAAELKSRYDKLVQAARPPNEATEATDEVY
jgi:beta-lactamase regulating signal transducer with metallopeptidase domain